MGAECSTNGGDENAYKILVGNLEGRVDLGGGANSRWEDNIVMVLKEMCGDVSDHKAMDVRNLQFCKKFALFNTIYHFDGIERAEGW
jgi:hypothetical protein